MPRREDYRRPAVHDERAECIRGCEGLMFFQDDHDRPYWFCVHCGWEYHPVMWPGDEVRHITLSRDQIKAMAGRRRGG